MRNGIDDLKNILFAQLEDLSDSENDNKIDLLVARAKASVKISNEIIKIEKLKLQQKKEKYNGEI